MSHAVTTRLAFASMTESVKLLDQWCIQYLCRLVLSEILHRTCLMRTISHVYLQDALYVSPEQSKIAAYLDEVDTCLTLLICAFSRAPAQFDRTCGKIPLNDLQHSRHGLASRHGGGRVHLGHGRSARMLCQLFWRFCFRLCSFPRKWGVLRHLCRISRSGAPPALAHTRLPFRIFPSCFQQWYARKCSTTSGAFS